MKSHLLSDVVQQKDELSNWSLPNYSFLSCLSIGLITVFCAILTGRQGSQKLQCLFGNPMANNVFHKMNFTKFMNRN